MESSVFKTVLAGALLVAPVLVSAQPQDTPPANARAGRPAGQMAPGPQSGPQRREVMRDDVMRKVRDRRETLKVDEDCNRLCSFSA